MQTTATAPPAARIATTAMPSHMRDDGPPGAGVGAGVRHAPPLLPGVGGAVAVGESLACTGVTLEEAAFGLLGSGGVTSRLPDVFPSAIASASTNARQLGQRSSGCLDIARATIGRSSSGSIVKSGG